VTERFPKAAYDPHRHFVRFDPARGLGLSVYCLVQFIALISANSHFLNVLPNAGLATTLAYFLYITIALITIGGVLENRLEFFRLETARLLLTAVAVIVTGSWFGGVHDTRVIAGVVAFCVLSSAALLLAARLETKRSAAAVAA
jgi:hypothetical protein